MKFLVTEESGRLVRWLRLMGYDTIWGRGLSLSELYRRAYGEQRVVLTRNRKIGASCFFRVVQLESPQLEAQLRQVTRDLSLTPASATRFSRCDRCNVVVEPIDKAAVAKRVPPYVFQTQARFTRCPSCERIYWPATHWQRACALLDRAV